MATLKGTIDLSDPDATPREVEIEGEELAAHEGLIAQAGRQAKATAFSSQEDADRLRIINERARTDPAFSALADYVLRGVQRP